MIEVVVEVDGRPLSRWGCDGVVCATPTGSTAYAFSAGGPVVWPEVEALLMVPISAHALFARPLVVAPTSVLALELVGGSRASCGATGVAASISCSATGSTYGAAPYPLRVARLHHAPFTDRLVAKFALPVEGWRGTVIEELRIRGLGVIDDAVLELGPGLTVVTGETGAGKTMVVTALGLLLGGRADAGAVRAGSGRTLRRGPRRGRGGRAGGRPRRGGRGRARRRTRCSWPARVTAEGRSRAHVGGRSVPVGLLADLGDDLVAVHGQSDQQRLLRPARQRDALDRYAGEAVDELLASYRAATRGCARSRRSSRRSRAWRASAPRRPTCCRYGLAEVARRRAGRRRGRRAVRRGLRGSATPRS